MFHSRLERTVSGNQEFIFATRFIAKSLNIACNILA